MSEATHVIDRDGNVWAFCPEYDGGMVTRAVTLGPISAGIAWLETNKGPLVPFNPLAYRVGALSRPVSAQDGVAGVDGRGGQGQDDTGRLT